MKLSKWTQVFLISMTVVALASCSSKHRQMPHQTRTADASYGAQSSGLGQETNFGEQAANKRLASGNNGTYYFDFDSNVVHDRDKPQIEANAEYLASHPNTKAMLEGHTDPRGSREYNIGLGERRAKAVGEIMISKGVNPKQLRVVSYGAEKLAADGHTEADYQQDRRSVYMHTQS